MVMALEAALVVVIGMHVDVFGLELVVEDALAGVEARITGEHERQAAAEREEDDPASAEELEREQERGDGAVHARAEHRDEPDGGR